MRRHRILILGGTTEARQLAAALSQRADCNLLLSLAGRTAEPMAQPVPVRSGGFGGSDGLAAFLTEEKFDLLIDATHPFAARISQNSVIAARATGIAFFALRRPVWQQQSGDRWTRVSTIAEAVPALGAAPRSVFLAIGRQEAFHFNNAPQHRYIIRSVDPVDPPLNVPDASYILATGPFEEQAERDLLERNKVEVIVAKNSGGAATYGKIAAARQLGIEVIMVERQKPAEISTAHTVEDALGLVDHLFSPEINRGV
ncbi:MULTISPECIES: cobalt-precorrin-6A reductase [unclassified Rhizobium]|uniref:cobalt-precorrin-6A reductase n=1 Tax=unclassified Rhizobium TaxID=2613769 RepID=UPI000714A4B1|nr:MULTISPECIES: cobalt-precorrin-6A reductase [unclassified Rhizobium]KQS89591.1 cobalt-precorrin-6X reductase [Rhizobium sp. Leaf391]KQS94871.1 cobalt-precorrin-6X reductase [Rhizobium sp. Leaf386]KQU01247.1 cobalt-precorrin-6X reductase [Rhizobium sp. Leaf453]